MSFHALLGAFPIAQSGDSLQPHPHVSVGELRASSRGGAFFLACRDLLNALPGHEVLRFIACEHGPVPQRQTDAQTRWTVLDQDTSPSILAALESLLIESDQEADALATQVSFGSDQLSAAEIRQALRCARCAADPNAATPSGAEGDTAEFVFSVLVSLRELLRRAGAESTRIAVFTWAPA